MKFAIYLMIIFTDNDDNLIMIIFSTCLMITIYYIIMNNTGLIQPRQSQKHFDSILEKASDYYYTPNHK